MRLFEKRSALISEAPCAYRRSALRLFRKRHVLICKSPFSLMIWLLSLLQSRLGSKEFEKEAFFMSGTLSNIHLFLYLCSAKG